MTRPCAHNENGFLDGLECFEVRSADGRSYSYIHETSLERASLVLHRNIRAGWFSKGSTVRETPACMCGARPIVTYPAEGGNERCVECGCH